MQQDSALSLPRLQAAEKQSLQLTQPLRLTWQPGAHMLSRSWWLWQSVQSMQRLLWPRRGLNWTDPRSLLPWQLPDQAPWPQVIALTLADLLLSPSPYQHARILLLDLTKVHLDFLHPIMDGPCSQVWHRTQETLQEQPCVMCRGC